MRLGELRVFLAVGVGGVRHEGVRAAARRCCSRTIKEVAVSEMQLQL